MEIKLKRRRKQDQEEDYEHIRKKTIKKQKEKEKISKCWTRRKIVISWNIFKNYNKKKIKNLLKLY